MLSDCLSKSIPQYKMNSVINNFPIRGQLQFHGSPTDIDHSSIYGKCQGSRADRGVWGEMLKN